jgi:GATA-binding protein, other eukaryote
MTYCTMSRNRTSGAPNGASRKGSSTLPKLASSSTRPRASTTSAVLSSSSGGFGLSASSSSSSHPTRVGPGGATAQGAGVVGSLAMKRQRRTSNGLPSLSSRKSEGV